MAQKSCAKSPPWAGQGNGWDWLWVVMKVFFLLSQKYNFIATIQLILNRLRVNPLIED